MAIKRWLVPFLVTAISVAVTAGCGSGASSTDQSTQPAGAINEDTGKPKKISATKQNGQPLTGAEKGAIMSTKGGGEP